MPPIAYGVSFLMSWYGVVPPAAVAEVQSLFEPGTPWYVMLVTMLAVGVVEETYFRYLVMDCICMRWLRTPYIVALIFSSIAFGMAHLANGPWQVTLPQITGAAFMGLWLARIYRKQGLHMAILTHGIYNFVICLITAYLTIQQ